MFMYIIKQNSMSLNLFKKIPKEIGKEIFSYLIPDSTKIHFNIIPENEKIRTGLNSTYSERYQKAYIENQLVENQTGKYLCRITKSNGKHRYYIAEECVDVVHVEHNDTQYPVYYFDYISTYVGKNIDTALIRLFF